MMSVASVLEQDSDGCHEWIEATYGRSVRVDSVDHGSGSLWARASGSQTVVFTTAAHVMSPCWSIFSELDDQGVESPNCERALYDPSTITGEASIRLAQKGSDLGASEWSASFKLFNTSIAGVDVASESGIFPRDDLSVYVVDSQRLPPWSGGSEIETNPLVDESPEFYDPRSAVDAIPNWDDPEPGSAVLVLGFPAEDGNVDGRRMGASIGRVLTDDEGREAVELLAAVGDAEGDIPYDSDAEFILEGHALPGMSGSGVFNENGTQVGIVVRASFSDTSVQYIRAVRMRHVVALMQSVFAELPEEERSHIAPYLPAMEAH